MVVVASSACTSINGEAYVSRRAALVGEIHVEDGRVGVPCTITVLLGDQEVDPPQPARSAASFRNEVSFLTPLRMNVRFEAELMLLVRCDGYADQKSGPYKVEPAWPVTAEVSVGTVTVRRREQGPAAKPHA